ncbi:hypothetical protein [Halobacteriovorax sp. HLS]|uniref:hypothetical protein n=1 Tax=Halobacteriovorax sp. HLS TaxID=2234000 RepID=UPI000FDBB618|nr:hypothetical protein [Halobacteriovorax sp. HLS]
MEEFRSEKRYSVSLTTPVVRDADAVFPGENWFLYWKTSSSLWKTKLEEFSASGKILIPINWSFHSDTGDSYDFADTKPETDLKKLFSISQEIGKEIIFLVPLTPVPFLANGGVPHLLARSISLNSEGMAYGLIDSEDNIHKLFSFYDSRVFQAYSKFCTVLGRYISEQGITSDVYGYRCGRLEGKEFISYLDDHSQTFEQAFSRFLQARSTNNTEEFSGIESIEEEKLVKEEFQQTISSLYEQSLSSGVSSNWEGVLDFSFLGGSSRDLLNRMSANDHTSDYSHDLSEIMRRGFTPSSILLPQRKKKGVLGRQLQEMGETCIQEKLNEGEVYSSGSVQFGILNIFNIFSSMDDKNYWDDLGLIKQLDEEYYNCFAYKSLTSFKWSYLESSELNYYFVRGEELDDSDFRTILKIFMNGGKVILDNTGLSDPLSRRLESFLLENNLEVEKVNFLTEVTYTQLGEGKLVIFNGEKLLKRSLQDRVKFWSKLVSTFEIQHIDVESDDIVEYFWRTRASGASELNYEEIRRISIYNPTSYKKKFKLKFEKNFALLKIIDEVNANITTIQHEINGDLLPDGSVSIDFGVFS